MCTKFDISHKHLTALGLRDFQEYLKWASGTAESYGLILLGISTRIKLIQEVQGNNVPMKEYCGIRKAFILYGKKKGAKTFGICTTKVQL